jgi:poly-gamma-glutamate synthesis protein (capsule biosynthesis protein)
MSNIIIGSDICPIGRNLALFQKGDAHRIFNDLQTELRDADLSVINLECPLIETRTPIPKCGPVLGVDSSCINGLKQGSIDVVNLANNHILDHGTVGLKHTVDLCKRSGIRTVGAGQNLAAARKIEIFNTDRVRIAILAVAEHEFSIATPNTAGANPYDPEDCVRNIRENRDRFDYLIVLFHGGNEHYPFPSPRLRDTCHFLVEIGANAVIVQHTHCAGCYEKFQEAHIIYGQGNLIFDAPGKENSYYEGYLVKLSIQPESKASLNIIPYIQSKSSPGARKMDAEMANDFLEQFEKKSKAILETGFIESKWINFCKGKKNEYLNRIYGHNWVFQKLLRLNFFLKYFFTRKSILRLQNTVNCEAHREVVKTLFENKLV